MPQVHLKQVWIGDDDPWNYFKNAKEAGQPVSIYGVVG
jgi:hypothetical protein